MILIDLPDDILSQILDYASPQQTLNLSCTSSAYRNRLRPFVFHRCKCTWTQIVEDAGHITLIKNFVHQLRLIDSYSYGQWHIDIMAHLHQFPQLRSLHVNLASLANWLRYRSHPHLTLLVLYSDGPLSGMSSRVFNMAHVRRFSLHKLSLQNYHFLWGPEDIDWPVELAELNLDNCTWEFPFTLSQFNPNQNLQALSLTYSQQHPFVLLERFSRFLDFPAESTMDSLHTLAINLANNHLSWKRVLSPKKLEAMVLPANFPALRYLRLKGWIVSHGETSHFACVLAECNLRELRLDLYTFEQKSELFQVLLEQTARSKEPETSRTRRLPPDCTPPLKIYWSVQSVLH